MNSSHATVLIADDSLVVRAVVRARLEDEGYDVVEAADGDAAVATCVQSPPDVVLLDVEMPGLDGHQVLARLKREEALTDIPVVFLTGRTSMDDMVAGLRAGAHDYLNKPFEAGLYNRRHLEDQLAREHSTARRTQRDLGVLLLDIDHFKRVNDTYGHAAGDHVLCEFAERMTRHLRAGDVAGRWGGEEFLVILPGTDLDGALHVAERIRASVDATPFDTSETSGPAISVTVSGGCVVGPADTPDDLVSAADDGLYAAKDAGRNRIIVASIERRAATADASAQ